MSKSIVVRLAERLGRVHGLDPLAFDPEFVAGQLRGFSTMFGPGRWFETRVHDLHRVPDRPSMIVSNHSGGTTVIDGFGFVTSWYAHFGLARPIHGLLHEVPFASHRVGSYLERCGMLRAHRDTAARVIGELGRDLVVMPGGDQEVWRPASQRYVVNFAGRTGYARSAIELKVPIVPLAHVGAHHTLYVLTDGRALAHRLRFVHALTRAEILPIHLSIPWGLAFLPLPHLPPPTLLEYRVGEPIEPPSASNDASVRALDVEVRRRVQAGLDAMRESDRDRRPRSVGRSVLRWVDGARSLRDLRREVRDGAKVAGPHGPHGAIHHRS